MITTILFDLDGTLLPMDPHRFARSYMESIARKLIPHGYDPKLLIQALNTAIGAMVNNDGSQSNETVFWNVFNTITGKDGRLDHTVFENYYENEFQLVASDCGFDPQSAEAIREIKAMGYRVVLATNPLFPAIATQSRIKWAGLDAQDFEFITTYENSYFCKPNPEYYRDILSRLNLKPENCVMVGNDVSEDMIAQNLGIRVFLMTDYIINRENRSISQYPHGSFPELLHFIRGL